MTKISKRRLEAIAEALHHRIQGGIDNDDLNIAHYHGALSWAEEQIAKREAKTSGSPPLRE
jgi:hypothetical protein